MVLILFIIGLAMFQIKYRKIGDTTPVFDGASNIYFVVCNTFGFSSIYVRDIKKEKNITQKKIFRSKNQFINSTKSS